MCVVNMINARSTPIKSRSNTDQKNVSGPKAVSASLVTRRPMAAIVLGHKLDSDRAAVNKVRDRLISNRAKNPKLTRGEKCIEDFF